MSEHIISKNLKKQKFLKKGYNIFSSLKRTNYIIQGEIMRLNSDTKFIREISEEEEKIMISKQEGQTQGYNEGINTGINIGIDKGKKEGKKEGIEEKNIEVIRNLLKIKTPIKTIAIATNLTEKEVKERIKKFNLE